MKILEFAFIAYLVTDEIRARAFYEGILGLIPAMEMRDGDQFWIESAIIIDPDGNRLEIHKRNAGETLSLSK